MRGVPAVKLPKEMFIDPSRYRCAHDFPSSFVMHHAINSAADYVRAEKRTVRAEKMVRRGEGGGVGAFLLSSVPPFPPSIPALSAETPPRSSTLHLTTRFFFFFFLMSSSRRYAIRDSPWFSFDADRRHCPLLPLRSERNAQRTAEQRR